MSIRSSRIHAGALDDLQPRVFNLPRRAPRLRGWQNPGGVIGRIHEPTAETRECNAVRRLTCSRRGSCGSRLAGSLRHRSDAHPVIAGLLRLIERALALSARSRSPAICGFLRARDSNSLHGAHLHRSARFDSAAGSKGLTTLGRRLRRVVPRFTRTSRRGAHVSGSGPVTTTAVDVDRWRRWIPARSASTRRTSSMGSAFAGAIFGRSRFTAVSGCCWKRAQAELRAIATSARGPAGSVGSNLLLEVPQRSERAQAHGRAGAAAGARAVGAS